MNIPGDFFGSRHCEHKSEHEPVLDESEDPFFFTVRAQHLISAAGLREDAAAVPAFTPMRVGQGRPRRWFSIMRTLALTRNSVVVFRKVPIAIRKTVRMSLVFVGDV